MLAINPITGAKSHVEVRIATSGSFALDYKDKLKPNGRPNKKGLDYFAEKKFNHPCVVKKVKELFGDSPYFKVLIVWSVKNTDAYGRMFQEEAYFGWGIHVYFMSEIIENLKNNIVKGSRDDVLRLIELISLPDKEFKENCEKEIRIINRRAKIAKI